jgi:uncharacterized protein HemY
MIRIQIDQVSLLLVGAVFALTVLRWLSLHVGLRTTLRMTAVADRWRLYREFARAHRVGAGSLVLVLKVFRRAEERLPVPWGRRGRAASR